MPFIDEQGRPKPPVAADETATLLGFLDFQRATLAWKCRDVDAAGLRKKVGPSSMTLGGLLKHLACVEDTTLAEWLLGTEAGPPWSEVDWDARPDWEWETAADDSAKELFQLWEDSVARSDATIAKALETGGLDQLGNFTNSRGESPTLRYIILVMIEEYARHVGHADLLRENVDGVTGE
ncbi:DinB family protein [Streptomyces sp. NPDC051940]|uniref:DinB family protein n=1 Tax=Streptomyces sp. NPDC051940 TaxID=3155675 RepID=UPI003445E3BC